MRLWEPGFRVVYEPDAVVVHYEFGSSNNTSNVATLQIEHQRIFMEHHHETLKKHISKQRWRCLESSIAEYRRPDSVSR